MSDILKILVDEPTIEPSDHVTQKAARPSLENFVRHSAGRIIKVSAASLAKEMSDVYMNVLTALSGLPKNSSTYRAKTISFTLTIDSSGAVSLVSAVAGTLKAQTGITFVLEAIPDGGDVAKPETA